MEVNWDVLGHPFRLWNGSIANVAKEYLLAAQRGSEIRETLSLYFKPLQALENRNISGIHIKMVEDC